MGVRFERPSKPLAFCDEDGRLETDLEDMDFSPLTAGNVYWVIGIEADWYRIVNDDGEPILYPPEAFTAVDPTEPGEWVTQYGDEGERYSYPAQLATPGLFENVFDGQQEACQVLRRYLQQRHRAGASEAPPADVEAPRDKMAA